MRILQTATVDLQNRRGGGRLERLDKHLIDCRLILRIAWQETILDASEDDQIQAAIRASLQAEKDSAETPSVSASEGDEPEEWFDSESESRDSNRMVGASRKASPSKQSAEEPTKKDSQRDWKKHLGLDSDPVSSIVIRYPDGTKEQLSLPCTSTILVVFVENVTSFVAFV